MAEYYLSASPIYGSEAHACLYWDGYKPKEQMPAVGAAVVLSAQTGAGTEPVDIYLWGNANGRKQLLGVTASVGRAPTLLTSSTSSEEGTMTIVFHGLAPVLLAPAQSIVEGDELTPIGTSGYWGKAGGSGNCRVIALETVDNSGGATAVLVSALVDVNAAAGKMVFGAGVDAPANNKWLSAPAANHANAAVILGVVEADGFIRNLQVNCDTAPGAGKTITYTVHKGVNVAGLAATLLTCTASGATSRLGEDKSNVVAVSKGDVLAIKVTSADVGAATATYASFEVI